MPICIECRYPVPQLYHSSSSSKRTTRPVDPTAPAPGGEAARSSAGAGDVRLTQCPRCKRFADKYVEHDFVILFIDLVLVKPQVYRHLLFNKLGREDDSFNPSITRLGSLLLLFDVYITWSHIESLPSSTTSASPIPTMPILVQYLFYVLLCALMTLVEHVTIRRLARMPWTRPRQTDVSQSGSPVDKHHARSLSGGQAGTKLNHGQGSSQGTPNGVQTPTPRPMPTKANSNAISTALIVSSCMKLFPMVRKWDGSGQIGRYVAWAVALQNMEALRILMGCSWWVSAVLVASGALAKWVVSRVILVGVGLGQVDI